MVNEGNVRARSRDAEGLPTLQETRRAHGLTSRAVAEEAGVPLRVEYLLEIGGAVSRAEAQRVLQALSRLTQTPYTEKDFQGLCIRDSPSEARATPRPGEASHPR